MSKVQNFRNSSDCLALSFGRQTDMWLFTELKFAIENFPFPRNVIPRA